MKTIITGLLLFLIVSTYAQRQDSEPIEFNYVQNPLIKINRSWSYDVAIIQKNLDELVSKRATYQEKLNKADADYQKALEAYQNYNAAEKLIAKEPVKTTVEPYFIGSDLDEQSLATRIDLEGFEKGTTGNAEFTININLAGFEFMSAVLESTQGSNAATNPQHFYQIKYRNPMTVIVVDKEGNELLNEEVISGELNYKTDKKSSPDEATKKWEENKLSIIANIEDKSTRELLKIVNSYINNQIGYPKKSERLKFYTGKDKKQDYSDLDNAIELVKKALIDFQGNNIEASGQYLKEALVIWDKALEEKDLNDKKARVNEIIATSLYINAGYASAILGENEKARSYLNEAKILRPSRFLTDLTELEEFIEKFQARS